jgi:predicted transposase/invertase (TIGR01784 family)
LITINLSDWLFSRALQERSKAMRRDDSLWKGILESVFEDFMRFFFKDADRIFDLDKGFEFLDKELEPLCPTPDGATPKFVDKLVKVFTRIGAEKRLLLHIEVQGYSKPGFPGRMFRYFYRITDKFEQPVTAIAILTDGNKKFRPAMYRYRCQGVSMDYRYKVYKVADQDESELLKNDNPFAVVILTVLLAIKQKKMEESELLIKKLDLAKNLLQRNLPAEKTRSLMSFINYYLHFDNAEYNNKFEQEIAQLTNNNETMGIEEFLLDRAEKKGFADAKAILVTKLLSSTDFPIERIADLTDVSEDFVINMKGTLTT